MDHDEREEGGRDWREETGRWIRAPLLDLPEPRPRQDWRDEAKRRRVAREQIIVAIIRAAALIACAFLDVDLPPQVVELFTGLVGGG